ncbi:hypothetical protein MJG53_007091 [Ovis ammon polii x Ovis aries]|uniref:Uncharacterized protein n=1 Tax=Ovis ammon polii x Ovis aries TaxID=2918886 RepID=A0ACB9V241_9CETA|nr:hypothetical protein MJT46_006641 [Ovis ammon polii x Ovis aries]KAI4583812.1 hypothetical protein MJG53_007091 [Ovis ammon polii x Ovis aries]
MNTQYKVFRRSPCALVPPHTCARGSTETGSSRLCSLRAQRLDIRVATHAWGRSVPGAEPACAQRARTRRREKTKWSDRESQVSSPSVATSSANRQLMMLEGKSGSCFSSLDSSIDILKKRAQELIENINESRQKDHALMTNFRDSLKIKVSDLTEKLEERMYQIYNHHNKIIQEKLQEFTQKMAKISHLETELKQVCHTVETVYKDLCVQPEV